MNQLLSKIVLLCAVLSAAWGLVAFVTERSQAACTPICHTGTEVCQTSETQKASNYRNVCQHFLSQ
jgi:hypothetical protein